MEKLENYPDPFPCSLKQCCLHVIAINMDMLLDAFENKILPAKYYEYLQRTSSRELLAKMKKRKDLEIKHVKFFVNPYIKELNLDAFSPMEIKRILNKLKLVGKTITSFRLTRFVYPKHIVLQLVDLLPNVQDLCLDKTRCSNQMLQCIAKNCPFLKKLDVNECFDIGDDGIKALCTLSEHKTIQENFVLEELNIWSTNVSLDGITFAIKYFPNLTRLHHYLLCQAIYQTHKLSALNPSDNVATVVQKYHFKELSIHPVNDLEFNEEILKMYSVLCPHVTSLRIFGIERQEEVDACETFKKLREISVFICRGNPCSLTSFVQSSGQNLVKLEICWGTVSLQSLITFCPKLQFLYLQHCTLEDLEELISGRAFFVLSSLKYLTLDDLIFPILDDSIYEILLASPNLEHLTLLYATSINNDFVDDLCVYDFVSSLRSVTVMFSTVKVSAIEKLMLQIPNLERIFLSTCHLSDAEYYNMMQLGKQNVKVQLIIKNHTHDMLYFDSHCPNISEDRELYGYGFDYEDDIESDVQ